MAEESSTNEADERLDFLSSKFDPLKALYSKDLKPPIPNIQIFNNLAEYAQAIKEGKTKPSEPVESASARRKRKESAPRTKNLRPEYKPVEKDVLQERLKALAESRASSTAEGRKTSDGRMDESKLEEFMLAEKTFKEKIQARKKPMNVLEKMEACIEGPFSILHTCLKERRRVKVWTRKYKGFRSVLAGYLVAFDKHMNLALFDVDEVYTLEEKIEREETGCELLENRKKKKKKKKRNVSIKALNSKPIDAEDSVAKLSCEVTNVPGNDSSCERETIDSRSIPASDDNNLAAATQDMNKRLAAECVMKTSVNPFDSTSLPSTVVTERNSPEDQHVGDLPSDIPEDIKAIALSSKSGVGQFDTTCSTVGRDDTTFVSSRITECKGNANQHVSEHKDQCDTTFSELSCGYSTADSQHVSVHGSDVGKRVDQCDITSELMCSNSTSDNQCVSDPHLDIITKDEALAPSLNALSMADQFGVISIPTTTTECNIIEKQHVSGLLSDITEDKASVSSPKDRVGQFDATCIPLMSIECKTTENQYISGLFSDITEDKAVVPSPKDRVGQFDATCIPVISTECNITENQHISGLLSDVTEDKAVVPSPKDRVGQFDATCIPSTGTECNISEDQHASGVLPEMTKDKALVPSRESRVGKSDPTCVPLMRTECDSTESQHVSDPALDIDISENEDLVFSKKMSVDQFDTTTVTVDQRDTTSVPLSIAEYNSTLDQHVFNVPSVMAEDKISSPSANALSMEDHFDTTCVFSGIVECSNTQTQHVSDLASIVNTLDTTSQTTDDFPVEIRHSKTDHSVASLSTVEQRTGFSEHCPNQQNALGSAAELNEIGRTRNDLLSSKLEPEPADMTYSHGLGEEKKASTPEVFLLDETETFGKDVVPSEEWPVLVCGDANQTVDQEEDVGIMEKGDKHRRESWHSEGSSSCAFEEPDVNLYASEDCYSTEIHCRQQEPETQGKVSISGESSRSSSTEMTEQWGSLEEESSSETRSLLDMDSDDGELVESGSSTVSESEDRELSNEESESDKELGAESSNLRLFNNENDAVREFEHEQKCVSDEAGELKLEKRTQSGDESGTLDTLLAVEPLLTVDPISAMDLTSAVDPISTADPLLLEEPLLAMDPPLTIEPVLTVEPLLVMEPPAYTDVNNYSSPSDIQANDAASGLSETPFSLTSVPDRKPGEGRSDSMSHFVVNNISKNLVEDCSEGISSDQGENPSQVLVSVQKNVNQQSILSKAFDLVHEGSKEQLEAVSGQSDAVLGKRQRFSSVVETSKDVLSEDQAANLEPHTSICSREEKGSQFLGNEESKVGYKLCNVEHKVVSHDMHEEVLEARKNLCTVVLSAVDGAESFTAEELEGDPVTFQEDEKEPAGCNSANRQERQQIKTQTPPEIPDSLPEETKSNLEHCAVDPIPGPMDKGVTSEKVMGLNYDDGTSEELLRKESDTKETQVTPLEVAAKESKCAASGSEKEEGELSSSEDEAAPEIQKPTKEREEGELSSSESEMEAVDDKRGKANDSRSGSVREQSLFIGKEKGLCPSRRHSEVEKHQTPFGEKFKSLDHSSGSRRSSLSSIDLRVKLSEAKGRRVPSLKKSAGSSEMAGGRQERGSRTAEHKEKEQGVVKMISVKSGKGSSIAKDGGAAAKREQETRKTKKTRPEQASKAERKENRGSSSSAGSKQGSHGARSTVQRRTRQEDVGKLPQVGARAQATSKSSRQLDQKAKKESGNAVNAAKKSQPRQKSAVGKTKEVDTSSITKQEPEPHPGSEAHKYKSNSRVGRQGEALEKTTNSNINRRTENPTRGVRNTPNSQGSAKKSHVRHHSDSAKKEKKNTTVLLRTDKEKLAHSKNEDKKMVKKTDPRSDGKSQKNANVVPIQSKGESKKNTTKLAAFSGSDTQKITRQSSCVRRQDNAKVTKSGPRSESEANGETIKKNSQHQGKKANSSGGETGDRNESSTVPVPNENKLRKRGRCHQGKSANNGKKVADKETSSCENSGSRAKDCVSQKRAGDDVKGKARTSRTTRTMSENNVPRKVPRKLANTRSSDEKGTAERSALRENMSDRVLVPPRKRPRSEDKAEVKQRKRVRVDEAKKNTLQSVKKGSVEKKEKEVTKCSAKNTEVKSNLSNKPSLEPKVSVRDAVLPCDQREGITVKHATDDFTNSSPAVLESNQSRRLLIGRDKCLVFKRRHVNQLFIRGDNVVMVAYAK